MIEDPKPADGSDSLPKKSQAVTGKRKRTATATPSKAIGKAVELALDDEAELEVSSLKKKKRASPKKVNAEEKRLRRYRQHAPASYHEKLNRATTQR